MKKIAGLFVICFLAVITLTWDAPPSNGYDAPDGYKVYCGPITGIYGAPVDVGLALEHPVSVPGNYYCAATAYNANGESGFSNEVFFTLGAAPGAPQRLRLKGF